MKIRVTMRIQIHISKRPTMYQGRSTEHAVIVYTGASLVAPWLRIRLPVQGTRVRSLVQEDPTCCRATKPVHHNY